MKKEKEIVKISSLQCLIRHRIEHLRESGYNNDVWRDDPRKQDTFDMITGFFMMNRTFFIG